MIETKGAIPSHVQEAIGRRAKLEVQLAELAGRPAAQVANNLIVAIAHHLGWVDEAGNVKPLT